jgi:hypothetical protein
MTLSPHSSKSAPGALLIGTDAFLNGHAEPALAIRHLVPAIYEFCQFVVASGLVCTENPIRVYRMIESAKLAR